MSKKFRNILYTISVINGTKSWTIDIIQLFIYDLVHKKGYVHVYRLSNEIFKRNIKFHKLEKKNDHCIIEKWIMNFYWGIFKIICPHTMDTFNRFYAWFSCCSDIIIIMFISFKINIFILKFIRKLLLIMT